MSCRHFPYSPVSDSATVNPAIQLFGNRLFSDQTISELLSEFLLVTCSPKKLGNNSEFDTAFPSMEMMSTMNGNALYYSPKARLNLKLFSFLGSSKLDSRHQIHRNHHAELLEELRNRINVSEDGEKDSVIRAITNLLLGFQGSGSGRTWCTQSFLPISRNMLARESIWSASKAKRTKPEYWYDLVKSKSSLFDMNKHLFYARGGELLYLQLCNALRQPKYRIEEWSKFSQLGFTSDESNPSWLHIELENAIQHLMDQCPPAISALCDFIDVDLDPETSSLTDGEEDSNFCKAGWCNEDSWQEGYLFAVELVRVLKADLDVVERIELLETAFAMQALRVLSSQSANVTRSNSDWLGYRLFVSSPNDKRPRVRRQSQYSVKRIQKMIYLAIRSDTINLPAEQSIVDKVLKSTDKKYGCKLYLKIAKYIGIIVPKRGGGERYVLNDKILRYLVITSIPLGNNLTYDTFKALVESHHGLVFDAVGLEKAGQILFNASNYYPANTDVWVREMLEAAGCLINLSDSCALVNNPATVSKGKQ